MKYIALFSLACLIQMLTTPSTALAHRSGCHAWHSCPSDSGSYVCGDAGHCSACGNNYYCKNGSYQPGWESTKKAPVKNVIVKKPAQPTRKEISAAIIPIDSYQIRNTRYMYVDIPDRRAACIWREFSPAFETGGNFFMTNGINKSGNVKAYDCNGQETIHIFCQDIYGASYVAGPVKVSDTCIK